ncbi:MAG: helix-turn-helix domain-containing protein [Erysipelotrichaceae bacterium]|nr:helix-turn-helix domain-containing protein [Erysipelotrichaceae bacterium]
MDKTYTINDLALMSGFTTRTLRNYLAQGILKGTKENGTWQFSEKEVYDFFAEPYVIEGLKIKHSSIVFDFLAEGKKKDSRTCVILDIPANMEKNSEISAFFCDQMTKVKDTLFNLAWNDGQTRVILSGAQDQVAQIMKAYYSL